jgi:hypothetical protein
MSRPVIERSLSCDQMGRSSVSARATVGQSSGSRGDAALGVLAAVVVVGCGLPLDGHDLERGEQQRGVQAALVGQPWDVAGDLECDGFGGETA